jgi:hypothetical protein
MGDRVEVSRLVRGPRAPWMKGRRPPEIIAWGLAEVQPAGIGHNNGPPLEEPVNDAFVRYRWRKAHAAAWKNPSPSIMRFRMARAEAAGVTYEQYVSALLDTGRHLQAGDKARPKPKPR